MPPPETPDTHRQVCLSLLWGHCSFLPGPGAHKVLLCPPRVCFPGGSQSFCWIPSLGNLMWALKVLQQWENFFGFNCSPVCGLSARGLYDGANGNLLQEDLCLMPRLPGLLRPESLSPWQVTADPCLCRRHSKADLAQCLVGGHCSFPLVLVCTRVCLHLPSLSAGLRFYFNHDCTPPIILLHFSFALGHGVLFFCGIQHSLSMVV